MPRFFFDTDDDSFAVKDEIGVDCPDKESARRAALACLPNMAHDVMPNGDKRRFRVSVRNEHGKEIYVAALTLEGVWKS